MDWKPKESWVRERNIFLETHQPKKPYYKTREIDYEAGADAMAKEVEKSFAPRYVQNEEGEWEQSGWWMPDDIWQTIKDEKANTV